jgi:hypothetical protein
MLEIMIIPERNINKNPNIILKFVLRNSINNMPKTKQMNDIAIT